MNKYVNRHTGGLEKSGRGSSIPQTVNRHTGGLENHQC